MRTDERTTDGPGLSQGDESRVRLPARQYDRVFAILERCDAAQSADDLKGLVLDSIGAEFGYQNLTCFTGSSIYDAFYDTAPSLRGSCATSWPDYHERWHRYDVLSTPESREALRRDGYTDLRLLSSVPQWGRDYIDGHMRKWGYRTSAAMHLELSSGDHALIGLTDPEPHMIDRLDALALTLLARRLSAISRWLPSNKDATLTETPLSERLREVAALVCAGRSNKQIAGTLYLSLDTVKKYVSRILAATGCRSRAEFIARYRPAGGAVTGQPNLTTGRAPLGARSAV